MKLTLKVINVSGKVLSQARSDDEVFLVYRDEYAEGDRIVVEAAEPGHIELCLDAGVPPARVFMAGTDFSLPVPFGLTRKTYPPQAFLGNLHRISACRAHPDEALTRRNLAFNPFDHHDNTTLFPHAKANVETRGEAVFAARNAIDGEKANTDHGFWPYTSWGINQDPAATLTLAFGRHVLIDQVTLYLRADFPHDSWWDEASMTFSDGYVLTIPLVKSGAAQAFAMPPRTVEWVRLHDLKKANDPSPFPALTQLEVWGTDVF
ncbi:hypothetical protein DSM25558_3421 [Agrobacterium sp. DSM 25558]|uniref:DUF7402 domain-containing protein n=1 Tax=Agrobacterium sp. DSM 25558 TaxID=1907665 RepID=UPI000972614C|nr:carbohydrate-binding protein [Agrobacterium sp. DSM 25558]SCX23728.1 hypothetical protein DSM25558_3421 [Agrobacterium sp. DSM 25558]